MDRAAKKKTSNGKFDPAKRYAWEEQDEFTVTGAEIDAWNRAINVMIAAPEFQQFLHVQKAAITMQNFLKESVEQGVIKEAPTEPAPQTNMQAVRPEPKEAAPEMPVAEEVNTGALAD